MRGHRSRHHSPALAFLIGIAGALSFGQHLPADRTLGAPSGARGVAAADVLHASIVPVSAHPRAAAGVEAAGRSVGRPLVDGQGGLGDGSGSLPPRLRARVLGLHQHRSPPPAEAVLPRAAGLGAGLLGLESAPANAPPPS